MILISNNHRRSNFPLILVVVLLLSLSSVSVVFAQSSQSLSISPTLFDMKATPGQRWQSDIRVINSNSYDLVVYVEAVNFAPRGEGGDGQFMPVRDAEKTGQTLAEWITMPKNELVIPAEQSGVIPIQVVVPDAAPPGGHYAAIMIGTRPPVQSETPAQVQTSQVLTSLFFLRVAGDVVEDGFIREFRTDKTLFSRPEAEFGLRFENRGSVHIQPQGEIKIFNMWGKERGIIPINQKTLFGNVLPEQVRLYNFSWTGEWSWADMGRYEAVVTIGYGDTVRKFTSSKTTFWVVPWQWLLGIVAMLMFIVWLITYAVRAYVHRMLLLAGIDPKLHPLRSAKTHLQSRERVSLTAPLEQGMLDLRRQLKNSDTFIQRSQTLFAFMCSNYIFFTIVFAVIGIFCVLWWYIVSASAPARSYEVVIQQSGQNVTLTSEDVAYGELVTASTTLSQKIVTAPPLAIVNHSGVSGTAARVRLLLETSGYEVSVLDISLDRKERRTTIIYGPRYKDAALALSELLGGVLVSAYAPADDSDTPITIYVGTDRL